jgi:DNA-binding NarL/FixJ family response regulator
MNKKTQIAIIDDHSLFRKSLAVLINMFAHYQVTYDAANGKDFISQLDIEKLPDIILMDINMPVMDGYATTTWVKANFPQISILALSTMDTESSIIRMIKCGAKGYILKDAEPDELRYAFDEVLSRGYFYNELITRKVMNSINQITEPESTINIFAKLNQREIEFLRLCCSELTYKEIAEQMFLSVRTVEGYRDTLCDKLKLKTRVGLAMYAIKNNLA